MSENEIRAEAIQRFLNMMIGALESGFVDKNNPTLYEIHCAAQSHVKENYGVEMPGIMEAWGPSVAKLSGFSGKT